VSPPRSPSLDGSPRRVASALAARAFRTTPSSDAPDPPAPRVGRRLRAVDETHPAELEAARLTEHVERLCRAAYALSGSRHDAEDLVQETFARVLARQRLVRQQDDPRYLMRALRNTWIDMRRARSARPVTTGGEALERIADRSADPAGLALEVQAVYEALRALSPKLREAIAAVDVLGMSYDEAARALSIRQGTLQSRFARAREQVGLALEPGEAAA
jgi:RNA polymerase sigma-70 factor (ECF subfamily)